MIIRLMHLWFRVMDFHLTALRMTLFEGKEVTEIEFSVRDALSTEEEKRLRLERIFDNE